MPLLNLGADNWVGMEAPHTFSLDLHRAQRKVDGKIEAADAFEALRPNVSSPPFVIAGFLRPSDDCSSDFELSTDDGISSEDSHADTASEIASIVRNWEMSQILDPTSIEAGFDFSCLECIEDGPLEDPQAAFQEMCWSEAVSNYLEEPSTSNPISPYCTQPLSLEPLDLVHIDSDTEEPDELPKHGNFVSHELYFLTRSRQRAGSEPVIHASRSTYDPLVFPSRQSADVRQFPTAAVRSAASLPRKRALSRRFTSFLSNIPHHFPKSKSP